MLALRAGHRVWVRDQITSTAPLLVKERVAPLGRARDKSSVNVHGRQRSAARTVAARRRADREAWAGGGSVAVARREQVQTWQGSTPGKFLGNYVACAGARRTTRSVEPDVFHGARTEHGPANTAAAHTGLSPGRFY